MDRTRRHRWLGRCFASMVIVAACTMFTGTASAFIDPPVLLPQNPVAGETISVTIRHGECDGFVSAPPQIMQTGNAIHMLLESLSFGDPVLCNLPTSTASFPLNSLPAGEYTLHVERFYESPIPKIIYETLGNYTFTVRGATPIVPLPSISITSALFLALVLVVLAWRANDSRRNSVRAAFLPIAIAIPVGASTQSPDHVTEVLIAGAQGQPTPEDVVYRIDTGGWNASCLSS